MLLPLWSAIAAAATDFGGKGRLLWGALGLGVWDGDARGVCGASRLPVEPCAATVVATTRSHPSEAVQAAADALNPHETRRVGGAGSKVRVCVCVCVCVTV